MSGRHTPPLPLPEATERSFAPSVEALRALQRTDAPDPAAVHHARTSVRRLRSNVRLLNGHVEPLPSLRAELGWIGECLGTVRDIDVLATRVTAATDGLPDAGSDGHLSDALAALPDKQRQAVAYHYLAGLPYAQVAEILGGSADAARRAAADGIKKLRGRLAAPIGESL